MKNALGVKTVKVTKTMPIGWYGSEKEEVENMQVEEARKEYKKWKFYGFTVSHEGKNFVELEAGSPYNTYRFVRFDW